MDSTTPADPTEERRDDSLRTVTPEPGAIVDAAGKPGTQVTSAEVVSGADQPPDGGITACFILNFVDLGFTYGFGVYQEQYKLREFADVSATQIDLVGSICVALTLFLGAFMGRPCQRYGMRAVSIVGSIVFFVGTLSAGFCTSIPTLIVTQGIIQGAGAGMLFVPGAAIPAQWFARRRALAIGIGASGAGLGGVFWSLIGRLLISQLGRQWALRVSSFINLGLCVIAIVFLKERKTREARWREGEKDEPILDWRMFRDPVFAVLYCASAVSVFGCVLLRLAPTLTNANTQVSMMNLGSASGRIILGAIADTRAGRFNTVLAGMFCAGASQWLFWSLANKSGSYALCMVLAIVYGLCGGGYIGIFPVVLAHAFDHTRLAAITGLFFTSELVGQPTGGPIAGAILQSSGGNYYPMIAYSGASLVLGSALGWVARGLDLRMRQKGDAGGEGA
ncbi:MFS general substrate transporter [Dacryopinax primogenitus]|uniref:MFS general substrate transporter n=1 Tax=Dacryopinax primogenitus (strain DJM 731) TaxID=1858805 RepID=M5FW55_DACPD|nr:MFS general substrate transporter [Dacryopinax primogenitus]EJU00599.1 MFS general substrate transporter [Dacryopinax primogenitus]